MLSTTQALRWWAAESLMGVPVLFRFKSKATSDLIMLEPDARTLLRMMLGDDPNRGIVLSKDLAATIARLETALAQVSAHSPAPPLNVKKSSTAREEAELDMQTVHVSRRAAPMLQMLKRCQAEQADLVWGV